MPIFTPGRRWQPPYLPFQRKSFGAVLLALCERLIKGPLFGCRMCGNCLLQETAFICPMACPKGIRNGPCGGSLPGKCYVDETRPCIWYAIYDRAFKMGREEMLLEVLPPLDWEKVGSASWGDVARQLKKIGFARVVRGLINYDLLRRTATWNNIFQPIRQPVWWQGDDVYHPPAYSEPISKLEARLRSREFVVTTEISPPLTSSTKKLSGNIDLVRPFVTAVNFTDSPSATPRMSSWACASIALNKDVDAIMQVAARDRTRIGLQSEILGASALGILNVLCISGDSMKLCPSPRGRMDIVDIDSIQMLWILRRMRDEGKYLDGREIKYPPRYFLGAAASPSVSDVRFQALREQKKVNAGAQFFQTNLVFDCGRMEAWLNELVKRNIPDKAFILIGITPLKSLKMAMHLDHEVPGVQIPKNLIKRMEKAENRGGEQEEGVIIALELIETIRKYHGQGVHGIHLMAVGWEEIVPRIVKEAHLTNEVNHSEL